MFKSLFEVYFHLNGAKKTQPDELDIRKG